MPRHRPEWPQEQIQRLLELADGTRTASEIGAAMGLSKNAIAGKVARLRQHNGRIATLSQSQGGRYHPWTQADLHELARRIAAGERPYVAARALGRTSQAVWGKIDILRSQDPGWPHSVIKAARAADINAPILCPPMPPAPPHAASTYTAPPADKHAGTCATPTCRLPRQRGYPDGLCADCRRERMPARMRAPVVWADLAE